jgi:WD40 repeat protein
VTGKKLIEFRTGPLADWSKMAFSSDGRLLALACQDRTIRAHAAHDGKELAQFAGHRGTIRSLAFALDGRTLFSGSGRYHGAGLGLQDSLAPGRRAAQ